MTLTTPLGSSTTECQKTPVNPSILILKNGDNIVESLKKYAITCMLKSASVYAIGSLQNITLGYFDHNRNTHIKKNFKDMHEIVSLTGTITRLDENYFVHLHAGISHADFNTVGGHVIDAEAGGATEFIIQPFQTAIFREFNSKLGIYTIRQ